MNRFLFSLVFLALFSSCRKEADQIENTVSRITISSGTRDTNTPEQGYNLPDSILRSDNTTLSAPQVGGVCQPGIWYIKQSYLDNYQHFYQINAKNEYPGNVLCGPTSYMLAAHMIASAKGHWYPSTKPKIGSIYNALYNAGKFDNAKGMYISDILWFCNTYDYPIIQTSYLRTSNRTSMKEYIEAYIKAGYPVIVTVNVYGMHGASWGNDLDMTDQTGTHYYVSQSGSVGHFILLIGIKINADGSGRIWYKDPLSASGETRCASYTRILDAMKYNGNNNYYDAVGTFDWYENTT